MKFVLFALMVIFFGACATRSTHDSMRGIKSNSILGTELGELYGLMYMYTLQNVCGDVDYEACENLLQSACDEGDLQYCTILGTMYSNGLNKAPNDDVLKAKVTALFKKACDGKNGSGCFALGKIYEYESKLEYTKYTRLACEYGDYAGCMNITLVNEIIFKELKHTLEHNMVLDEAESKEVYATAKDVAKSALWGYERLVPLLQKECENAKKRIKVVKETHKTLGAKFLGEYEAGHIDFDTLTERTDRLQEQAYYDEFLESRYCESYKQVKDDKARFKKGFEGF